MAIPPHLIIQFEHLQNIQEITGYFAPRLVATKSFGGVDFVRIRFNPEMPWIMWTKAYDSYDVRELLTDEEFAAFFLTDDEDEATEGRPKPHLIVDELALATIFEQANAYAPRIVASRIIGGERLFRVRFFHRVSWLEYGHWYEAHDLRDALSDADLQSFYDDEARLSAGEVIQVGMTGDPKSLDLPSFLLPPSSEPRSSSHG